MLTIKHNKKRNSGLMYEFLIRRLGNCMLENNKDEQLKITKILRKYFSVGQPLAEEYKIFDTIINNRGVDSTLARKILEHIRQHAISVRNLDVKKSNFIKEVHHIFGKNFFDDRIPDYRLYASICTLLENYKIKENKLDSSVERSYLEESLIKYMTNVPQIKENKLEKDINNTTVRLVIDRFKDKYKSLNESQKKILRQFINCLLAGNKGLDNIILSEKKSLLKKFDNHDNLFFKNDVIMLEKFNKTIERLRNLQITSNKSKLIEELLLYHELAQELSDE